ncbi:MAG: Tn7-like element transposition protein TnsE [Acinetobacter sp.]
MSDCRIEYLPDDIVYYTATDIRLRRNNQTRFDILTYLFNPKIKRLIELRLPIESVLLYHYKTTIADHSPKKLFDHTLKNVNFTTLKTIVLSGDEHQKIHQGRICFEFDSYSEELKKNITIQIPKLVLARDLFFSHPYLLRAALFAENYSTDVTVDLNDTAVINIYIAQNKKILKKDLSDPYFLKKLALILLQPDLNRAFLSIYKRTIENQKSCESFSFDMDAPKISNIDLDVDGIYQKDSGIYIIERIISFKNIDAKIDRPVQFHSNSQEIIIKVENLQENGSKTSKIPSDDKTQLDQKSDADIDKESSVLMNITGEIYTMKQLQIAVKKSSTKKAKQKRQKKVNDRKKQEEAFAGGEANIEGTRPGLTTQSKTLIKSVTRQDLIRMLSEIRKKGYKVKKIYSAPFKKYARFRNHKFANNQQRYFYVYQVLNMQNHAQFYLCEIDTSDGKKNISTLVIKADEKAKLLLEKELARFNNVILAQSLSWPKKFLSEIRGITEFITINHPSRKDYVLPQAYYADWAQRILEKIQFF